jgi:hypothetical protein
MHDNRWVGEREDEAREKRDKPKREDEEERREVKEEEKRPKAAPPQKVLGLRPFMDAFLDVFTLPNMLLMHAFFPAWFCAFTLPGVNCRLELAPQFTLLDPTHGGGFILIV